VCGFIKRSGKRSCCGRGGSWFGKCGGTKSKSAYTWFTGIQACKPRFKSKKASKVSEASNAAEQKEQDDYYQMFVLGAANITTPAPLTIPLDVSIAMSKYDTTTTVTSASTASIATTSVAPPTTKPSTEKSSTTTAPPTTTTTAPPTTTVTIPVKITHPVKVTTVSPEGAENDDFLKQIVAGSVSVFASHLSTMFFGYFILFG
jgi:hypothetical protein